MDNVDKLIDELLADEETSSEFGRARAYRRCVRYAETELAKDHACNLFLLKAAERLDQEPMAVPVVHNLVPLPDPARLSLYYAEDEGPTLVGNASGLRYLSRLCAELAKSPLPGENVVLSEGYAPWVGDSDGLTIFVEDEAWFMAAQDEAEDEFDGSWEQELHGRIVNAEEVAALQLAGPVPSSLALSPQKLYRIARLEDYDSASSVKRLAYRDDTARVRVVDLLDDDGEMLRLAVDLDDPTVTFYYDWHLEQLRGAADA